MKSDHLHKTIIDSAEWPCCPAQSEDMYHMFFDCPASIEVWLKIDISPPSNPFNWLWTTTLPHNLPSNIWNSVALIILWKIWDSRNAKVFRAINQPCSLTIGNIIADLTLVSPFQKRVAADLWRDHLTVCNLWLHFSSRVKFRWGALKEKIVTRWFEFWF